MMEQLKDQFNNEKAQAGILLAEIEQFDKLSELTLEMIKKTLQEYKGKKDFMDRYLFKPDTAQLTGMNSLINGMKHSLQLIQEFRSKDDYVRDPLSYVVDIIVDQTNTRLSDYQNKVRQLMDEGG